MTVEKKVRASKDRMQVGTSLDKRLYEKLRQLSKETRIPQSKLFDEALELLFEKHGKE